MASKLNTLFYKFLLLTIIIAVIQSGNNHVAAQSIRIISTQDGLPQSFISGLEQDKQGFIWIGTRNGLARYDGMQFVNFQHNIHDTSSLASNIITWLRKDNTNHIWIEYESGEIDVINPATQQIQHFISVQTKKNIALRFSRRGWYFDSKGIFWGIIKNGGLNSFDTTKRKLQLFTAKNGLTSDTFHGVLEDRKNQIWILSQNAISLFNRQIQQFKNFIIPYTQEFNDFYNADERIVDLHERQNGEIMWGDSKKLIFFNPKTNAFRFVNLPEQLLYGIRWIRNSSGGAEYIEANGIIYQYDDSKGLVPFSGARLSDAANARSFLIDQSGLIWVGTNAEGIHQIDPINPFFQSFAYKKDFCSDIFSAEFGLSLEKDFHWTSYDQKFSSPAYHMRSFYDNKHQLWLALKETVYFKSSGNKWIALPHVPWVTDSSMAGIGIKGIGMLPDESVLILGYNGNLVNYNFQTKTWSLYLKHHLLQQMYGQNILPQDLLADSNKIWITMANNGLISIDINSKKIYQLKEGTAAGSLPTNQLLDLEPDPSRPDILWIGSYQGLIALNKKTFQCKTFSVAEGLPDNTIYSIQTDEKGNLWLSTNKGLCRFQPVTHEVRIFQTQNGLPGDEFNRFHHLKLPDNELAFGGTAGWVKFDPLSFKDDNFKPAVVLTGLKINYVKAAQDSFNYVNTKPPGLLDSLKLNYDQNTLTFQFSALQFNQPQDNLYRYRLDGYDKDWVIARNAHEANYTQLPPGNYTFNINASNTTGKWSPYIKKIAVIITPPWWLSTMAYICYAIIIIGLIWGFIRYRITEGIMKREIVLKENESLQMKELDEMKTRFFSNITHEFRTPLTLIIGPAEELKQPNINPPKQNQLADTIIKNARQLLVLVNRLLDLSRLEAKALKIHEQKGNPALIVGSIVHSFEFYAKTNEVQLRFINNFNELNGWFYPDALERIVYNLVSNALRFTSPGGNVIVSLEYKDETMILTVNDTGIGISESQVPFIFERFYQGDKATTSSSSQTKASTGIGLALVKELVELQNGNVIVQSSTGNMQPSGTSFTVTLPFRLEETAKVDVEVPGELISSPEKTNGEESTKASLILLVEDNAEVAEFITGFLSVSYQVKHAANGESGINAALSLMPDVIVTDVVMPGMDGYAFCDHIKKDMRTCHIPVILLTAKASQENVIEGLSKGADDYITKPFHPTEFLLRIQNLLERQKKLSEKIRSELSSPEIIKPRQKEKVHDAFIEKLYGYIDEHLDDPLFGVDQLVNLTDISRTSLHRKLKAVTGLSTGEFIRNYKLKQAVGFLKQGFNSTDTAYKSGFGSPAYFTKCFRETYGITPGEYVRQHTA